jgi:hypothetical protein
VDRPSRMAGGRVQLPLGSDPASVRQRLETLEKLLERSFVLPGINRPVGLDAVVGLIPVAGDTVAAAIGLYLIWEARNLGMSRLQLGRMIGNVGFDWLVGLVPVVGDVLDFVYRSNSKNLKIVLRHLDRHHPSTSTIDADDARQR